VSDALAVAERALSAATGDGLEALVHAEHSGLARFAESEVHQPTLIDNTLVQLRVVRDGRSGWAVTNRLTDEGLAELGRRAEDAAESAPADSHFPGLAPPAEPPGVEGFDEETAALGADELAHLARTAIEASPDLSVYGYVTSGTTTIALRSTTGLSFEQRATDATALVLAAGPGLSGYADASAWAVHAIDPAAVAVEAAEKALRTRNARPLEPGTYAAVLEPYALAELLDYFAFDTFNGLGLLEERSYFAGRVGEKVFDERVSIADDALDPRGLPKAFDFEGTPKQRVPLVEAGVARGVVWDRGTARRSGQERASTGHAPPLRYRQYGPFPFALSVAPGDAESADELLGLVGDGISVTRLHYLSVVEPREGVITGMTRDGTFRVRDGRLAEPLANLRFTVSVPSLLANVRGLAQEVQLVNRSDFYDERYPVGVLCPALATGHFTVTGSGSGPGL
jgi:predicted Zn-dependent protease